MTKRRPASLTLRLTLLFGVATAIVFSGFGWFIEHSIERHFRDGDIAELKIITNHVTQTLFSNNDKENPNQLKQRLNDLLVGHHSAILSISKKNGTLFFTSINNPSFASFNKDVNTRKQPIDRWKNEKHTYRVLTSTIQSPVASYNVTVAVAIDHHLTFLNNFRNTLWIMIASGFTIMGLLGWFAVRQGYRPLYKIVRQIQTINAQELNIRLDSNSVPQELVQLAGSFNQHLERMENSFQKLSDFSADIAHELRTPVTNLMTQTQVALSQTRTKKDYQEVLYSNIEEYERLSQMISDMLFLAKAENNLEPPNTETIELDTEFKNLYEYYGVLAEEKNIELKLTGSTTIKADRLMLRRAFSNLLSNALRHTPANGSIITTLEKQQDVILIEIRNTGKPIPNEHLNKLFDRFYRADPSRKHSGEGAGLGLAIVKSIIEAHRGKILALSDQEIGTRFRITLPSTAN